MRVGRGAGRVATTRLHYVARVAAQEVHAASASNPQALHEFLRTFAADLQPASRTATVPSGVFPGPQPKPPRSPATPTTPVRK
jgi:hypothetical protein